jgi:hypothetical protein
VWFVSGVSVFADPFLFFLGPQGILLTRFLMPKSPAGVSLIILLSLRRISAWDPEPQPYEVAAVTKGLG